ncbi:hypothetical protein D3C87_952520 [compost metagenome]
MAELTEREELMSILSDVFKSAHGFRPRGMFADYSIAELRAELARQDKAYEETAARERAQEEACAVKFEARIADLIASGAGDRETAIRWDKDALGGDHIDDGYYEYLNGLRYGYFAKDEEVAV